MDNLYKNTGNNGYYRDFYEPINLNYDSSYYMIVVTDEYHHKPGNLVHDLYCDARYSWVFRYFNPNQISGIIFDLQAGMMVYQRYKNRKK